MNNMYGMVKTKKIRRKMRLTKKKSSNHTSLSHFPLQKINNIISKEDGCELKGLLVDFFEKEILPKIENCPRPIKKKYGDFLERSKGRFEIIPSSPLENKILKLLFKNKKFAKINKEITEKIGENVIQELCILPVEPNTKCGVWHRDIFINSKKDFERNVYYITQIIYLDDKANTNFCINSQNNSNNNHKIYTRKIVEASPLSSVVFDGRTLHKGLENNTKETRYAIYISYHESSYIDKESIQKNVLHKKEIC
jgi:hypothetical protein